MLIWLPGTSVPIPDGHSRFPGRRDCLQASGFEFVIPLYEFVILLFSLSFHESAHAWMASRRGDQTARLEGRITLNPARHIDILGTLVYPALMAFGPLIGFAEEASSSAGASRSPSLPATSPRGSLAMTISSPSPAHSANLLLAAFSLVLLLVLVLDPRRPGWPRRRHRHGPGGQVLLAGVASAISKP